MWELDLDIQKARGFLQGWTRGFYKNYSYEIPEKCLDKYTTMQIYFIDVFFKDFDFLESWKIFQLMYNIYYTWDFHCDVEDHLYDLANFCFDHNCEPEQLLQNEMGKVFQVTGALNALAALYYEEQPDIDQHLAWFDQYNEVGLNVGKLFRYTLAFDPRDVNYRDE